MRAVLAMLALLMAGEASAQELVRAFDGSFGRLDRIDLAGVKETPFGWIVADRGGGVWSSDGEKIAYVRKYGGAALGGASLEARWFFGASDGQSGRELYTSDGTRSGTSLLVDLLPGSEGSDPRGLLAHEGALYFLAATERGSALFRSDGRPSGTTPIFELGRHYDGRELVPYGDRFVFVAAKDDRLRLFSSDGTPAGTREIAPVSQRDAGGWRLIRAVIGETILFFGENETHGQALWISDGTPAGTRFLVDVLPGARETDHASDFVLRGEVAYFIAGARAPRTLFRSDGTEAGTRVIGPTSNGAIQTAGDRIFFFDGDAVFALGRDELPAQVYAASGTLGSELVVAGGKVLFLEQRADRTAVQLVAVDPETLDAEVLHEAAGVRTSLAASGALAFFVVDGMLFRSDGSKEGTRAIGVLAIPGSGGGPTRYTELGSGVVFDAGGLFFSDGTEAGTREVLPDAHAHRSVRLEGGVAWVRTSSMSGSDLWWWSDGDSSPRMIQAEVRAVQEAGDFLLMLSGGSFSAKRLLRFDATLEQVDDVTPPGNPAISDWDAVLISEPLGDAIFFGWWPDDTQGLELFRIARSGTAEQVRDSPVDGEGPSEWMRLHGAGPRLYLLQEYESTNRLHVCDGERFIAIETLDSERSATASDGRILLDDRDERRTLVFSDGTKDGTRRIELPIDEDAQIEELEPLPDGFLITVRHDDTTALWFTDGTEDGTRLVDEFVVDRSWPGAAGLSRVDDVVLFGGFDATHGAELWMSDGTIAGTHMLFEIQPGVDSGLSLVAAGAAGDHIYFTGYDYERGNAVWRFDRALLPKSKFVPPPLQALEEGCACSTRRSDGSPWALVLVLLAKFRRRLGPKTLDPRPRDSSHLRSVVAE